MKKLLLVVDYQKDFVDGALGFPGAEALDGPIAEKIAAYRAAGDDVAFTMDTHQENYLDTQPGGAGWAGVLYVRDLQRRGGQGRPAGGGDYY